jgi:hypothetical protein
VESSHVKRMNKESVVVEIDKDHVKRYPSRDNVITRTNPSRDNVIARTNKDRRPTMPGK